MALEGCGVGGRDSRAAGRLRRRGRQGGRTEPFGVRPVRGAVRVRLALLVRLLAGRRHRVAVAVRGGPRQGAPDEATGRDGDAGGRAAAAEWGAGFRAQQPAASAPGTVAVLDEQCRWQRRPLPASVLASLSRYSELPGAGGRGTLKVTAVVTVHADVSAADQQLSTTLEEPLLCRVQQVRTDEQIAGLMSAASPYGEGGNTYADDQVVEIGQYLSGASAQTYRWYVTRLGTVTVAVSVMGATGYTDDELVRYASPAVTKMLDRVKDELGGKS